MVNTFTCVHSYSSFENHTWFQNVYLFSDQKGPETIPFGKGHTLKAYKEVIPSPPPPPPTPAVKPCMLLLIKTILMCQMHCLLCIA